MWLLFSFPRNIWKLRSLFVCNILDWSFVSKSIKTNSLKKILKSITMNNQNSKYGKLTALRKLLRINSTLKKSQTTTTKTQKLIHKTQTPWKTWECSRITHKLKQVAIYLELGLDKTSLTLLHTLLSVNYLLSPKEKIKMPEFSYWNAQSSPVKWKYICCGRIAFCTAGWFNVLAIETKHSKWLLLYLQRGCQLYL